MEIDRVKVSAEHVHIFLCFPPKKSFGKVIGMLSRMSFTGEIAA